MGETRAPGVPFGAEHEELRERVRRFARAEVAPHVDEWERAREFPRELFRRCGELGFLGLKFPEELGGQGGDYLHDAVWAEELARSGGSGGVGAGLGAHGSIAMPPIFNFGTEEQKRRWLVPGIAGEKIGALGITEPGAGSDVASIQTRAEPLGGRAGGGARCGAGWVVNGAKTFITNGVRADFLVCAVKTTGEGGHGGLSFLVLEREMPGYEVTQKLEKLGWHSSDTAELAFTDVEVPAENLLGAENEGFRLIMANFAWERLSMALGALGGMDRLIEDTVAYAGEPEPALGTAASLALSGWSPSSEPALGTTASLEFTGWSSSSEPAPHPAGTSQATRHQVAEMAMRAQASRSLTYHALRLFHEGLDCIREVTMAKLVTQRALVDVAETALRINATPGTAGAAPSIPAAADRALRDARLGPIGGGTDEIMKEILGKQMGL